MRNKIIVSAHALHGFQDAPGIVASFRLESTSSRRNSRCAASMLLTVFLLASLQLTARAQSAAIPEEGLGALAGTASLPAAPTYQRPTERTMARNYFFDTFGPYPIAGAAFTAALSQASNAPPEWSQGAAGYSRRFGSDFGIAAVGTTTRYALAEAYKEDTLYYRCECKGVFPRLRHAVFSTLTARRGSNGHRVFSFPSLVAPYAGSMTAVYGWYPSRYGAKDAFRIGNYGLLGNVGGNIALEFLYSGPHSLLSRLHLNNSHGAPRPGPSH